MTAHPPPIPPDQRSPQGGDAPTRQREADHRPERDTRIRDPREQGQSANTRQNTTNKGYQQDR